MMSSIAAIGLALRAPDISAHGSEIQPEWSYCGRRISAWRCGCGPRHAGVLSAAVSVFCEEILGNRLRGRSRRCGLLALRGELLVEPLRARLRLVSEMRERLRADLARLRLARAELAHVGNGGGRRGHGLRRADA